MPTSFKPGRRRRRRPRRRRDLTVHTDDVIAIFGAKTALYCGRATALLGGVHAAAGALRCDWAVHCGLNELSLNAGVAWIAVDGR